MAQRRNAEPGLMDAWMDELGGPRRKAERARSRTKILLDTTRPIG